ncbi:kinase-like domain-containing protein [Mrakia frigida]|uniref:kinase-like domain-containing protein n=1 Tax=Mrakia frigida TaxID=29902 RepID=UPI003FCBF091
MPFLANVLNVFSSQPPSVVKKREYKFLDVPPLGSGGYATVRLARWKHPHDTFPDDLTQDGLVAVKIVDKKAVQDKEKYMRILVAGWGHSLSERHPHICPLLDWFESSNHYYLTFPLMQGGELLQKILDKKRFSEEETRRALIVILDTLVYIHHQGVIHRDIKAENFLYRTKESPIDDFNLIDFGISKILDTASDDDPKIQMEVSGTPGYAAPEVFLRTGYGKNADCFSVGVVGYAMLCGSSPWDSKEPWDLVQETVKMREVNFKGRRFDRVSEEAKNFICLLMTPNPHKRPSSAEARAHEWLQNPCPPSSHPPTRPASPNAEDAPGPRSGLPDPDHPMEVLRKQDTLKPGVETMLSRRLTRDEAGESRGATV